MSSKHFLSCLSLTLSALMMSATAAYSATTNVIRLQISQSDYEKYAAPAKGNEKKVELSGATVSVNGSAYQSAKLKTRGQSCLGASRRCFALEAASDFTLYTDKGKAWQVDEINLASMYEDTAYINNKIGWALAKELGLSTVKNTYVELVINGRSQGLYLALQKPTKVAKKLKSGIIIRRREEGYFEVKKYYPQFARYTKTQYLSTLEWLYSSIKATKGQGSDIYSKIKGRVNMPQYFRLLTLQTLIYNGDYSDEVYFYARPGINGLAFDILPWDFEDLFAKPHESSANKRAYKDGWFSNSILYSFEDPLDVVFYNNYQAKSELNTNAKMILTKYLTPELFRKVIDKVKKSVSPYLDNKNILTMSYYDEHANGGYYSKKGVLDLLETRYAQMVARREQLLRKL